MKVFVLEKVEDHEDPEVEGQDFTDRTVIGVFKTKDKSFAGAKEYEARHLEKREGSEYSFITTPCELDVLMTDR